jgi:hypothetical protein
MRSSGAPLRRKKELQCGEMRKIEREERRNEDTGFWEGCSLSSICRTLLGIAEESRTLGAFGTRPPTSFMQTKLPESFAPCRVRSSPIADALAHIDNYHPPVSLERQMRRIALYCLSCASSPIFQERTGRIGMHRSPSLGVCLFRSRIRAWLAASVPPPRQPHGRLTLLTPLPSGNDANKRDLEWGILIFLF